MRSNHEYDYFGNVLEYEYDYFPSYSSTSTQKVLVLEYEYTSTSTPSLATTAQIMSCLLGFGNILFIFIDLWALGTWLQVNLQLVRGVDSCCAILHGTFFLQLRIAHERIRARKATTRTVKEEVCHGTD